MNIIDRLRAIEKDGFYALDIDWQTSSRSSRQLSRASLQPYTGSWTEQEVAHLLQRTLIGYDKKTHSTFEDLGRQTSVEVLLDFDFQKDDPPTYNYPRAVEEPNLNPGDTWILEANTSKTQEEVDRLVHRISSFKGWWMEHILTQEATIEEKMVLFWHNILVTSSFEVFAPARSYHYHQLLKRHAIGNFRALVQDITLDGAMMLYLNGTSNSKEAPDENYARELQELFTIGKGSGAGFTESDVREAARVLTGWRVRYVEPDGYFFRPNRHDFGDKVFSEFYGHRVIPGSATTDQNPQGEIHELVDMLLSTEECPRYLCRRLYQFFVYPILDEWTEQNIISPLARLLVQNDFEIKPVLETLLNSEHFYDPIHRGALIKSPVDYVCSLIKNFDFDYPSEKSKYPDNELGIQLSLLYSIASMGQDIGDPPNVSGWPPYYQSPSYDYLWISTVTLASRQDLAQVYVGYGVPVFDYQNDDYYPLETNILRFIASMDHPEDPTKLIQELFDRFLVHQENKEEKISILKSILLSGQNDDNYWTEAWLNYLANKADPRFRTEVLLRLQRMLTSFVTLPDYHLC